MILTEPIYLSMIGGLLYQLFPIIENLKDGKDKPSQFNPRLIFILLFYAVSAGIVGYVYFDGFVTVNKFMALQIGATTPLILKAIGNAIPGSINKVINSSAESEQNKIKQPS